MKKFFASMVALFVVGFQIPASVAIDEQDNSIAGNCYELTYVENDASNPLSEFRIYFDNAKHDFKQGCSYKKIESELNSHIDDIEGIIVIGSADTHREVWTDADNIELSKNRAKTVINNVIPTIIGGHCGWDGIQDSRCSTYAIGAANDYIKSLWNGSPRSRNNSNADERSVRVYIRWRFAKCMDGFVTAIPKYKTTLNEALSKYPSKKTEIEKIIQVVNEIEQICPEAGKVLYASEDEKLQKKWKALLDLGLIIPEINIINQQYGITRITIIKNQIDSLYARLMGGKRSVWKNAEGGFNTARLASDSIAGVVLGTAGGLITSKIVRKNQLKQGFEDIKCSVAGQNVASYGDTMNVGLQ